MDVPRRRLEIVRECGYTHDERRIEREIARREHAREERLMKDAHDLVYRMREAEMNGDLRLVEQGAVYDSRDQDPCDPVLARAVPLRVLVIDSTNSGALAQARAFEEGAHDEQEVLEAHAANVREYDDLGL